MRIEVCKEALTLEALGPVPSCGSLNDKCPHRFMNLETWSLVGDPVCGGPGCGEVQLDWRKYTSGWALRVPSPTSGLQFQFTVSNRKTATALAKGPPWGLDLGLTLAKAATKIQKGEVKSRT